MALVQFRSRVVVIMNFLRTLRLVSAGLVGLAGLFSISAVCLGFGGVGVSGAAIGVRSPGVAVGGISTSATGGGLAAGTSASVGSSDAGVGVTASGGDGGVTAGGGASLGGGGGVTVSGDSSAGGGSVSAGGGANASASGITASGSADADVSGESAVAPGVSTSVGVATGTDGPALAAQRSALQMGVGPFVPDRGMAQALGYGTVASGVVSTADSALQSAVSGMPALPTAPAEGSALSEQSPTVSGAESAPHKQAAHPPHSMPHPDRPLSRHVAVASGAALAGHRSAAASVALNESKMASAPKAAADSQSPQAQVVAAPGAAIMPVDADGASSMSMVVEPEPPRPGPAGQSAQDWSISGRFPDDRASSLPTAPAIVLVMILSAASAWGFVRLMSERCPQCSALLERHSAGCGNCGAHLRPSVRSA